MIVTVKRNKKQKIIKIVSIIVTILMFFLYYQYMKNEYNIEQKKELEQKKAKKLQEERKINEKKRYEKIILKEIEKVVDLIGQENVQHVKIVENKILIICDLKTNLDALMVRYGTMSLVKKTLNEIIIILDINYIIESKLDE